MIITKMSIISDYTEQSLDLFISFDNEDADKTEQMTIKTNCYGKDIVAVGTHYPYDDAFSDLQNQLPKNVQIKCCVACCHGNQCPVGDAPCEVFCTKDVNILCKSDCFTIPRMKKSEENARDGIGIAATTSARKMKTNIHTARISIT